MPRRTAAKTKAGAEGGTLTERIIALFDASQKPHANHDRLLHQLRSLQAGCGAEAAEGGFLMGFMQCLYHALLIYKREAAVERCIDFVAKFIAGVDRSSSEEVEEEVSNELLSAFNEAVIMRVLEVPDCADKAVRFRVCQLISKILNAMEEDAEISVELCEAMESAMLERIVDKIPVVRIQAIRALVRLQDPSDADCPIIAAYLQRLDSDSSPDVRLNALTQIGMSKTTVKAVIKRVRDVKDSVRKHAFCVLGEKVDIRALTIEDRVYLLTQGLKDRADIVQKACGDMLCKFWFASASSSPVKLLKLLDVENETESCALALTGIIAHVGTWDLSVKDFKNLDCETALWWRVLAEHYHAAADDEKLEGILPDPAEFGRIVRRFCELEAEADNIDDRVQAQFITKQLLQLALVLDYTDDVSRTTMTSIVHEILSSPGTYVDFFKPLIAVLAKIYPDDGERIRVVAEVIADKREPIQTQERAMSKAEKRQRELQIAKLKVDITQAEVDKEQCVRSEAFADAGVLKARIEELRAEMASLQEAPAVIVQQDSQAEAAPMSPETLVECMTIAQMLLAGVRAGGMANGTLAGLVESLFLPCIQNEDPAVREKAVRCLGLCAMIDRSFARTHLLLFLQIVQVDQEVIQMTALEVLFDLVLVFGAKAFDLSDSPQLQQEQEQDPAEPAVDDDGNPVEGGTGAAASASAVSVITVLHRYLDSEDPELRTIAVEGFCKLLLMNHISSSQIFSHLVLLYFNPTTEDDVRLRQCLSLFFPTYAFSARAHQDVISGALLPTLRTIMHAPRSSPLQTVKPQSMAEFLIYLTGQEDGGSQDLGIHDSVAMTLCNEILSNPTGTEGKTLARALSSLQLAGCASTCVKSLRVVVEQMLETIEDKATLRVIQKFDERLAEQDAKPDEALSAEAMEQLREKQHKHRLEHEADMAGRPLEDPVPKRETRHRQARSAGAPSTTVADSGDDSEAGSDAEEQDVSTLLDKRKRNNRVEYLVEWSGDKESSWETRKLLMTLDAKAVRRYEQEQKENKKSAANKKAPKQPRPSEKVAPPAADSVGEDDEVDLLLDESLEEAPVGKRAGRSRAKRSAAQAVTMQEIDDLLSD